MDIAVLYPFFDTVGGAEKFGLKVMEQWSGHDVTLYSMSADSRLLRGLDAEYVEVRAHMPKQRSLRFLSSLFMKQYGGSVGLHDAYLMVLYPTHLVDRHPSVWYPQEPPRMLYDLYPELMRRDDLGFHKKLLMKLVFPYLRSVDKRIRVDSVVANSRYSADYLRRVYGRADEVVYMGVDGVADKPAGKDGGYILCVNRLMPEKRVDLAIRCLRHLPEDVKLKVVGEGGYEGGLRRIADDLGLTDRVEFTGVKFGDELDRLYRGSLCTVYTPVREPFGLVPLESLAQGTPVIGCLEGGFTEVLSDGVDSFLVDPTPENIAGRVNKLIEDDVLAYKMGAAGIKTAGQYPWSKTAEELLNILRKPR